jgi:tRNA dimethylallyltransferase
MFAAGLIAEVQAVVAKYGTLSRTAAQAVGYGEVLEFLNGTQPSEQECHERVKAGTRQFARRQETWFHSLSECTWVPLDEEKSAAEVAESIAGWFGN